MEGNAGWGSKAKGAAVNSTCPFSHFHCSTNTCCRHEAALSVTWTGVQTTRFGDRRSRLFTADGSPSLCTREQCRLFAQARRQRRSQVPSRWIFAQHTSEPSVLWPPPFARRYTVHLVLRALRLGGCEVHGTPTVRDAAKVACQKKHGHGNFIFRHSSKGCCSQEGSVGTVSHCHVS